MFCFKCGKRIRDDAIFCQYCGAKQSENDAVSSVVVSQPSVVRATNNNGELDREALKIYLRDVLSLECIKANYERKIINLRNSILKNSKYNGYLKRYDIRKSSDGFRHYYAHFFYNGQFYFAVYKSGKVYADDSVSNPDYFDWCRISNDSSLNYLKKAGSCWEYFEDLSSGFFDKWSQREEARDSFFKAYEEFKAQAPGIYKTTVQTNTRNISNWQQQINGMSRELETVKRLLNKAYAINIIPSQFRYKIHAIYYLHDFVSTSRESFTTALLHFDLDEIKAKLDRIIAQQESIIIQNAVRIAQNEKLAKQNQLQLEQLSKIESNTNQAAQYAQIAANNAETCAWISIANYIEARR